MNPRFLERLECSGLSVRQPWFRAALGKSPAPAAAGLNQQEFDLASAHAIADRCHLFAFAQLAKLRQSNELSHRLMRPNR